MNTLKASLAPSVLSLKGIFRWGRGGGDFGRFDHDRSDLKVENSLSKLLPLFGVPDRVIETALRQSQHLKHQPMAELHAGSLSCIPVLEISVWRLVAEQARGVGRLPKGVIPVQASGCSPKPCGQSVSYFEFL